MDKKLTLSLDSHIIEKAKRYASKHKTSLSRMIESYFDSLTLENEDELKTTPLVESLCGVIPQDEEVDYKTERAKYLNDKYQ